MHSYIHRSPISSAAKYAAANAQSNEVCGLADEKAQLLWKAPGNDAEKGCVLTLSGKASEAIQMITSGITTHQSTVKSVFAILLVTFPGPMRGSASLTRLGAALAKRSAQRNAKERWCEAEVNRIR